MESGTYPFEKEFHEIERGIQVALGEMPADLVLQRAQLVNVFTEEVYPVDICVSQERIVALVDPGTAEGTKVIDCEGLFAVPGLIDGHVHIESSALALGELVRIIVPQGVTTLLADPHEIANVLGMEGIRVLLQDAERLPIRILLQVPARVPTAPGVETTGGVIGLPEVEEMLTWENTVSLGELDPSKVVPPLPEYIAKVVATRKARRITNGHAAELVGRHLNAYISAGIYDDHECTTAEGTRDRARLGMTTIAREGTFTRNVEAILESITRLGLPTRNIIMCTDDKLPHELVAEGHLDYNVRLAMRMGIEPIEAIQMATLNCAEHFHLGESLGSVSPGRYADVVLVSDLQAFKVEKVIFAGKLVAQDGNLIEPPQSSDLPEWATTTVRLAGRLEAADFRIAYGGSKDRVKARIIDISQFLTSFTKYALIETVGVEAGKLVPDLDQDILKIAVVERHKATGNIGLGLVKGFGLKRGALASSVSHDHHNIVVVGASDGDMAAAVNALADMQGGFVAVEDGQVLASVPLEFGGLMSIEPYEDTVDKLRQLDKAAKDELDCPLPAPIMMLLGVSLPTIPEVGISDLGVVQVGELDRVPHLVDVIVDG